MFKKTMSLVSIILLLWAAALASNYFFHYFQGRARALTKNPNATTSWPDPSYLYTFAVLAIGLVSFVAFLSISRELRGSRDTFQDGDVRFALTCSFVRACLRRNDVGRRGGVHERLAVVRVGRCLAAVPIPRT
jgi:hypothetical protein